MRLDIYDTTMHETRSELKPWYPRVLHAACTLNPQTGSERIGRIGTILPRDLAITSEVRPGHASVRGAMEEPVWTVSV